MIRKKHAGADHCVGVGNNSAEARDRRSPVRDQRAQGMDKALFVLGVARCPCMDRPATLVLLSVWRVLAWSDRRAKAQAGRFCCDARPLNPLYLVRDPWPWGKPHEAAGIRRASRQRCGGNLAARGARAAANNAGDRVPQWWDGGGVRTHGGRVPPGPQRSWLCRGPQRGDRVSLGPGPI